jgi:hypothetical protein
MILCRAVLWDLLDDLEFGWYLVVMSREWLQWVWYCDYFHGDHNQLKTVCEGVDILLPLVIFSCMVLNDKLCTWCIHAEVQKWNLGVISWRAARLVKEAFVYKYVVVIVKSRVKRVASIQNGVINFTVHK